MYEDNFNTCTSFNVNLYEHPSQQSFVNLPIHFKSSKCYVFHENSFDLKTKNKQIEFKNVPENVVLIDLYENNPWLEEFIKKSAFKDLINHNNYWHRNAQYWFRKVVSIVNFINLDHDKEFGLWVDCDTYFNKNFDEQFFNFIQKHDWCCYFRPVENCSIESGIQVFKINEKTKLFSKKYLEYYLTQEVFKQENNFADNFVLNSCFNKFGKELKLGKFNTNESFNIYDYIGHKKATLTKTRENL